MNNKSDNFILGVIEHGKDKNTPDINYITSVYAFFNPKDDPDFHPKLVTDQENLDNLIRGALKGELIPKEFTYKKNEGSPVKRYSLLYFQMDDPAEAASNLSKFVDGVWNSLADANFNVALDRCSAGAIQKLVQLLTPYQHSDDTYAMPGSEDYFIARDGAQTRNVENALVKLGLMTVDRNRYSVTQCTASVKINGQSVADFGDEIWLRRKDNTLSNGFRNIPPATMYGDIISGWGSIAPDETFRRAAIIQFPGQIAHELEDYGRNKFLKMVRNAQRRSEQSAAEKPPVTKHEERGERL